MNWASAWDHGLNWALFTACFLVIELGAIYAGRHTLSETFWDFLKAHEILAVLALSVGLICLVGHFLANWWRG